MLYDSLVEIDPEEPERYNPAQAERGLLTQIDVDGSLARRGLKVDQTSRRKLLFELATAEARAYRTLEEYAHGNESALGSGLN